MEIDDFFPIPVGNAVVNIELSEDESNFIKKEYDKKSIRNVGNKMSENKYILENDCMKNLKVILTDYINDFFIKVFEPNTDVRLFITNSWLNWSNNGEFHHLHYHANSLISGVLYLDASDGDSITFWNPNCLLGNMRIKSPETGKWNSKSWKCPIKKNELIVFPSYLKHEVENRPNVCRGTRISLAFNTWFKGQIGGADNSNELHC
jgi:uncharacterized protein (TIGR02466 family)